MEIHIRCCDGISGLERIAGGRDQNPDRTGDPGNDKRFERIESDLEDEADKRRELNGVPGSVERICRLNMFNAKTGSGWPTIEAQDGHAEYEI